MSVLDKLKRGTRGQAKRAPRLDRHSSEHTPVDEWVLDDLKRDSTRFRERIETPIEMRDGRQYEPSADIHDDLFLTAHATGESRVKDSERMRPSHRFGRDVLDAFVKTDEHRGAKPFTEQDELASAIYANAAADKFDELMFDKSVQQEVEQSQNAHEAEQRLEQIEQQLEDLRGQANNTPGQIPGDVAEKWHELTDQRVKVLDELAGTPAPGPLPANVAGAVQQAAAEGKKHVDAWAAIAGSGTDLGHVTPDEAMALTEQWIAVPDFEELCKLLGRIQRDFRAQEARNVIGGHDEVVGIELGNNLTNTLPSELGRLGNPLTQRSFIRDYTDESLLQFQTQSSEKVDMGPGVLCIDLSGSMNSTSGSEGFAKHTAAKAVAVGFVRLMHRKKRDAIVICFNGNVMWEHHFPKRDGIEMEQLLNLAALAPSGGTDITKAVARAEKLINTMPGFKRADVLVVTDGQDRFDDTDAKIRDRLEKAGVRRHGVAIGHTPAPGGWLLSFCDDAISVDDLTSAAGDIVRAIS